MMTGHCGGVCCCMPLTVCKHPDFHTSMRKFIEHARFIRQGLYCRTKWQRRSFLMNRMFGTKFRVRKYDQYQTELFA